MAVSPPPDFKIAVIIPAGYDSQIRRLDPINNFSRLGTLRVLNAERPGATPCRVAPTGPVTANHDQHRPDAVNLSGGRNGLVSRPTLGHAAKIEHHTRPLQPA